MRCIGEITHISTLDSIWLLQEYRPRMGSRDRWEVDVTYAMQIVPSALNELRAFKPFYQRQIASAIDQQLPHQPNLPTRHRKLLTVTEASFAFDPPLWELRIGDIRVFYDVNESDRIVSIRAIREKPPHASTEDVL